MSFASVYSQTSGTHRGQLIFLNEQIFDECRIDWWMNEFPSRGVYIDGKWVSLFFFFLIGGEGLAGLDLLFINSRERIEVFNLS